jgi:hypothetical protein
MEMAIGGCGVAGAPAGVRAPGGPPVDHLTSRLHGLKRKALPQSSPHHSLSHRIVWCVGVAGAEVSYGVEERQGAKVPCAPGLTHTATTSGRKRAQHRPPFALGDMARMSTPLTH